MVDNWETILEILAVLAALLAVMIAFITSLKARRKALEMELNAYLELQEAKNIYLEALEAYFKEEYNRESLEKKIIELEKEIKLKKDLKMNIKNSK
ncbi:hypothetical protein GR160_03065 [Flavobacterium sp. Sd200]|uniref:hypothetical protein n=1 Tax=Flavobacterium sp. Sd200 TaxID=2692211 RepID=UPI0013688FE1|nr:hypothetical protein [Flavobacterium sp. Sd200]MXN90195.1 hypothetical protein [Flavobacterium sp. Sd200]